MKRNILSILISILLSISMVVPAFAVDILYGTTGNKHYKATWAKEGNQYTLYYDANGGSVSPDLKTVTNGSTYGTLPVPERNGYMFTGWYTQRSGGTERTSASKVALNDDEVIYAHWAGSIYTVTFDANGGSVSLKSKNVTNGSTYGTLPTPERDDYIFEGWYTGGPDGTRITEYTTVSLTENIILYAQWRENKHMLLFDANGGYVDTASKKVTNGVKYGKLPVPKWDGYMFTGWFTERSGGEQQTEDTIANFENEKTLYAHWEGNIYMITLDPCGGSVDPDKITVTNGSTYGTIPTPERDGYVFNGWYTDKTDGVRKTKDTRVNITQDETLYAHWKEPEPVITFDPNGGTVPTSQKTVHKGSAYGALPSPSYPGHTFDGWFTKKSGGTQVTTTTVVTESKNHTLYAHWTTSGLTIYFDANGGTVSPESKSVTYNSTYGTLPTPVWNERTFDGWYTSRTGGMKRTSSDKVLITANETLYAHWLGASYTVYYDANGGTVSPSSKTVLNGHNYGTLPTPTRSGYRFGGWYTEREGGTQVLATTMVSLTGNTTIYAHWLGSQITVHFDPNGGTTGQSSKKVTNGSNYGTLPKPTYKGRTFDGWFTSAYGGTEVTAESAVNQTQDHTLYAHWTINYYTITFNPNGGSVGQSSKTLTYGSQYGSLPTPTWDGYKFEGWFTKSNNGTQITSSSVFELTTKQTLYAHWTKVEVPAILKLHSTETIDNIKIEGLTGSETINGYSNQALNVYPGKRVSITVKQKSLTSLGGKEGPCDVGFVSGQNQLKKMGKSFTITFTVPKDAEGDGNLNIYYGLATDNEINSTGCYYHVYASAYSANPPAGWCKNIDLNTVTSSKF